MNNSDIKEKTISGLLWSFTESFANQGLLFIIGIILARLLTPKEFGLIGMITIFIAISESFIDSGFSQALIRKKDITDDDLSTAFYFNFVIGIIFFIILILCAPLISGFFNEPQLIDLIRVLGIVLIIDSLSFVQRTTLTRRIDFKLQAKISVISTIASGIIAILMATSGFGVWSLVAKTISQKIINSFLLWLWNHWVPQLIFSRKSFKELYSFGSKLLISGLIDTLYRNIYYLIIGKYFSAVELGYYTRADQFNNIPSKNINGIISRVSYPVLAQLQDDPSRLKNGYKKIIKSTMLVTFILMFSMAAVAEPMIITLIGEKWRSSIVYLQLLCFIGALYPLHSLNLNMLNVRGRSDLFLQLEIVKKILAIPTILIGIMWGIKIMIIGMWVNSLVAYYLNSYYSGQLINYPTLEQVKDIMPSFLLAVLIGALLVLTGKLIPFTDPYKLIIQIFTGGLLVLLFGELLRNKDYLYLKDIIKTKILSSYNVQK